MTKRLLQIERLEEMLEGQVAAISSKSLSGEEALRVLEALRSSRLYCPERKSYMLQPDRILPSFLEKNLIPDEILKSSKLIKRLVEAGDKRS